MTVATHQGTERLLPIEDITVDPEVQDRADLSEETIKEYAASDLSQFPPVRVWDLGDGTLLLSAGHHTLAAHDEAGKPEVRALVFQGTKQDAILDAVRSNTRHGLRRSGKDRRRSVSRLVLTFPDWSSKQIADEAQVDNELVESVRKELAPAQAAETAACAGAAKRTDSAGRRRPASREEEEKQREWIRSLIKKDPTRTGRDIAAEVNCSSRTVDIEKKKMAINATIDAAVGQSAEPKVLCERCSRVGAVTGCTKCLAAQLGAKNGREPGDDTEAEEKARKEEKQARKRNGKELYDWKAFDSHFGYVRRGPADLSKVYPSIKNGPEYAATERLLKELYDIWGKWRKKLVKA